MTKVIMLLEDMIARMSKEAKEDEEIYKNIGCWYETNDEAETKSIADAEARICGLTAIIEEMTGENARLDSEVCSLGKEVPKSQQALDAAKQLAEFNAEEKDMMQSITSLKNTVISLSKHNSASLLRMPEDESENQVAGVHAQLSKHDARRSLRPTVSSTTSTSL